MFLNKQNQIFIGKKDKKNLIDKLWKDFLYKETYLIYDKKNYFNLEIKELLNFPRLLWFLFIFNLKVKKFKQKCRLLSEEINNYNENFINKRLNEFSSFFDGLDDNLKYKLDYNQRLAVIRDDKHNLVIAGAGSGKTLTLTARIAYLIRRKDKILPEKILALAFTRNTAQEMKDRLKKEFKIDVDISTFHSLGWNIIKEETNKKPNLLFDGNENEQYKIISDIFRQSLKESKVQDAFIKYLAYYLDQEKEEDDFASKEEYFLYMRNRKYTTLNNIEVKSFAEKDIANFLFMHDINFQYEPRVDWIEKESQDDDNLNLEKEYHPDFYLPDYAIYIEHWGLNENNQVPKWFTITSEEYLEIRKWKLLQFQKYNKKLIETWDYQRKKNTLLTNLKLELVSKVNDMKFIPLPYEILVEKVNDFKQKRNEINNLVVSFIRIAKANYLKPSKIETRINSDKNPKNISLFGTIALETYKRYQEFLQIEKKIDYNDMINDAIKLIKKNPEKYLNKYDHILIDEFQDISYQRMKLIQKFVNKNSDTKLFCVGDDWQSIYQFNGSDIRFFVNFQDYFTQPEVSILNQNYRSSKKIIEIANDLISHNKNQIKKKTFSLREDRLQPIFINFSKRFNFAYQNQKISYFKLIKTLIENGVKSHDIMVLSRFNKQLIELEQYCGAQGINIQEKKYLGIKFYSVHKAKGTECKHVIIMNVNSGLYGFPCEIQDSSVLDLAKRFTEDNFFEEERRLFYVALTRSKKFLYIHSIEDRNSMFLSEIKKNLGKIYLDNINEWEGKLELLIKRYIEGWNISYRPKTPVLCPQCGMFLVQRSGKYGKFLGCKGYPNCRYTFNLESEKKWSPWDESTANILPEGSKANISVKASHYSTKNFEPLRKDKGKEKIKYKRNFNSSYIEKIYWEFETEKAVKFRRTADSKIYFMDSKKTNQI
ncbi:MAG: UvrD-helicase domain-containing protein [Promethearchaeota archaeon]